MPALINAKTGGWPWGATPTKRAFFSNLLRRTGTADTPECVSLYNGGAVKSPLVELEERIVHTLMPGVYRAVTGKRLGTIYDRIAREALRYRSDGLIVDVGCGGGHLLRALRGHASDARLLGVDPAHGLLNTARRAAIDATIEFSAGEAGHLPLAAGSVGLALSTGSVHHWPSLADGLAELARVLRHGAYACIYDQARYSGVGAAYRALRQGFVGLGLTALPTEQLQRTAEESPLTVVRFDTEGALVRLILQKPSQPPTPTNR